MRLPKKFTLLVAIIFTTFCAQAQLRLRGFIYSEGPIQASLKVESYPDTHFLYLDTKHGVEFNGREVFRTRYDLPWDVVKDYNHTIKFTDGTVEKIVFVDGSVPEDIVPKQKFYLDIDLTNGETADEMVVVFWSLPDDEYIALPLSQLAVIREKCMDPSIWKEENIDAITRMK